MNDFRKKKKHFKGKIVSGIKHFKSMSVFEYIRQKHGEDYNIEDTCEILTHENE